MTSFDRFVDKTVLVTGGNSGIGLAAAQRFAAEGARVIATGRDAATLAEAATRIGHDARTIVSDTADLADIERLMRTVATEYGRLDVLFANAGVSTFGPFADATADEYDRVTNVNVRGLYFTVQKAVSLMHAGGAVVLTASVAAHNATASSTIYSATKAAVRSLGRTMGGALVERGIRVNVVSPGPIDTPIFTRGGRDATETRKAYTAANPMKRFGTPEEVAAAVLFLASDEASYITSAELLVDGGLVAR